MEAATEAGFEPHEVPDLLITADNPRMARDEEQRLVLAVQRADAERHARQTAIRFGVVVDAYRDYMIREGKGYKRAKSLIDKIEAFVGADRDVAAVDFAIYQGLLGTVAELHPETRRHYDSTLLAMLNHAKAVSVIVSHKLEGVRVPEVARDDEPEPWTPKELSVIMGPALKRTKGSSARGTPRSPRRRRIAASAHRRTFRSAASASSGITR